MIDEEKDLHAAEQAPRRRQRITTRETERVYSASQDQGERFDTIETERYIKRVIQSRSKEELTAALRALKEQAMPKKKRGRPSKRDIEEQRILKATIARHMDEINATRAALMGDVTGTPVEMFDEETGFAELAQHLAEDTTPDVSEGVSANAAAYSDDAAEEAKAGEDDVLDFVRMQQTTAIDEQPAATTDDTSADDVPDFVRMQQELMPDNAGQQTTAESGSDAPDFVRMQQEQEALPSEPKTEKTGKTLGELYAEGTDFLTIQDVPNVSTLSFTVEEEAAPTRPVTPPERVDYLARTRSFLNRAGALAARPAPEFARPMPAEPAAEQRPMEEQRHMEIVITCEGVLDFGEKDKQGMLRSSDYNYLNSPDDVFISLQQIRQYALKKGDVVLCHCRPPRFGETKYVFLDPITINGLAPQRVRDRVNFEHLTPIFPDEQFRLSRRDNRSPLSCRIVDLFAPIGKGQRALIVAQPKTGKTVLMKQVANAIAANYPDTYLMMLLIDERPEEVTDMARTVNAEVIASTFDESAANHTRIAQIVLEKAKRMVECGRDVVIFLDSITRLARAFNAITPMSGRILTGGVDANALQMPKRFFGAARNIEGGGSLTIIATALIDTGSKMDEVIFEEFKGTGNMELLLDRNLANKRIFPAVNLIQSSTRRDDLLLDEQTINRMFVTRNYMADMSPIEAMSFLKRRLEDTVSNEEFIASINK